MVEKVLPLLLVVEETNLREALTEFFSQNGSYAVEVATDANQVWERVTAAEKPYQVVLLDDLLPPRQGEAARPLGVDLIRRLKAHDPQMEIILLTTQTAPHVLAALRAGAYSYLPKPANFAELALLVSNAAHHQQLKREASQLYAQAEARACKLAAVLQVSTAINASGQSLDRILQMACEEAVKLLGVDHSALVLFAPNLESGQVRAEYPTLEPHGERIRLRGSPAEEHLIDRRQPLVILDVAADDSLGSVRDLLLKFDICSAVFAPVISNGQLLGSFSFDVIGRRRAFSADDVELCQVFAAQVAVAIENASLLEKAEQRAAQLQMLRQTALALIAPTTLNRQALLSAIIEQAVALLQAQSGGLYEYYPERQELQLIADYKRPEYVGKVLKVGEGIAGLLVQSGEPFMFVADYDRSPHRAAIYGQRRPFGAVLEVQLRWQERTLGVLYVDDRVGRKFTEADARLLGLFADQAAIALTNRELLDQVLGLLVADNKVNQAPVTDDDVDRLLAFANTAAIAIENIRLFNQASRGREKLHSFYRVNGELRARQNPTALLEAIVEETLRAADATWVGILLFDEQDQLQDQITIGASDYPPGGPLARPSGISRKVLRTGKAVAINDIRRERTLSVNPALLKSAARAVICLPLSLPDKRLGVMWILYNRPHEFFEFEIGALQLYVNQVAMAYETAQWMEGQEQIRQAADALIREMSTEEVLQQILHSAQQVLRADAAVFWFYDDERDTFILDRSVAKDIPVEIWENYQKIGPHKRGTAYRVMQKDWALISDVTDPAQNQELGPITQKVFADAGVRSLQGIALRVGEEKLGVIYALYSQPYGFSEEKRKLALIFANHAALALKNARLFEQVRKTKEAAEAVAKITVLGDRQATVEAIVREVRKAMDCDVVALFEYDQQTNGLIHPATIIGARDHARATSDEEKRDYPLVYQILEKDEPCIVEQVHSNPDFKDRRFARDEEIKSCVAAPLRAQEQRVGVLFVNYRHSRRFTAEEAQTIRLFANQAAVALRDGQLFEARARKLREQEALLVLSTLLLETVTLQETLDRAVGLAAVLLGTEFCNIVLPDREGRLIFRAGVGWGPEMVGRFELAPGKGSQTGFTVQTQEPVVVDDYAAARDFDVPDIVNERSIRSGMSVPMLRDGKVIGAMLVHTTTLRHFNDEEVGLLKLVANQTAIALRGVERYEELLRKTAHLNAVHEASKVITASFGLPRKQVLDRIIERAVEGVTGVGATKAVFGTIQLYDEATQELVLESVYVPEAYSALTPRVGERWPLDQAKSRYGRIGITGRTILTGQSQLVRDVGLGPNYLDPDYLVFNPTTRSELSVPLLHDSKALGALNVESDQVNGFDEQDQMALEALAEHAVIGIQNARQYEELKKTQSLVIARTAVAMMGMKYSAWGHGIPTQATTIIELVTRMRQDLSVQSPVEKLTERLAKIEELAVMIQGLPETASLSDEIESVCIHALVKERIRHLCMVENLRDNGSGKLLAYRFRCGQTVDLTVRASKKWLKHTFDILVDNAIEAMAGVESKMLRVSLRLKGASLEIVIRDNGCGIPADVLPKVLSEPIIKPKGAKGSGVGLLLAQVIAQAYGGDIRIGKTGPAGTRMIVSLPVEGDCTNSLVTSSQRGVGPLGKMEAESAEPTPGPLGGENGRPF